MRSITALTAGAIICLAFGAFFFGTSAVADQDTAWPFIRGDANVDGHVDIGDVIDSLNYLFLGADPHCLQSHDANDDDLVDVSDPIYLVIYLFAEGTAPPHPFPSCGWDHTPGTLTCDWYDENQFCETS